MELNSLTRKLFFTGILFIFFLTLFQPSAYTQTPPPPPPPQTGGNNGHGLGGNQGAPGAPIGGGLEMLILMGVVYAGKRYIFTKDKLES
jgi:hypothetical protein